MSESSSCSPISEFYRGRSVLITGGTGFVGKVLVEKLLRSFPDVGFVFLLMRPKRGQDARTRLSEMLKAALFDNVRHSRPELLRKVVAVSGDITQPDLGLSPTDRETLIQEVSVVFHSAATVKFDEALKLSIEMNLLGTKRMLQLCHSMKKLQVLVHVSTAYCNCNRKEVAEKVYPAPTDPDRLAQCVEWMDADLADYITPKILGDRPNTYTFTKALAESLVVREAGDLPVAIVRPSIVTASLKEPIPGWVDNLNGPTGLLIGAGKGVLRTLLCYREMVADIIPVDLCINLLVSVAWHTAHTRPSTPTVYNCVTGAQNPITWRDIEDKGLRHVLRNPYSKVLWYPGGSFKSSRAYNELCTVAFHLVPAYIIDIGSRICGKKPIMVHIQRKLQRAIRCLEFFTTNEWEFSNDNVQKLWTELTPTDRKNFDFDVTKIDWDAYLNTYVLGTRRFVLKDDPSTFPEARKHLRNMYIVHRLSQLLTLTVTWRFLLSRSRLARHVWVAFLGILAQSIRMLTGIGGAGGAGGAGAMSTVAVVRP